MPSVSVGSSAFSLFSLIARFLVSKLFFPVSSNISAQRAKVFLARQVKELLDICLTEKTKSPDFLSLIV